MQNTKAASATVAPATYPTTGCRWNPSGEIMMKLTQMNVRNAAGTEHIQCGLFLVAR
jgi:hypothetical protein